MVGSPGVFPDSYEDQDFSPEFEGHYYALSDIITVVPEPSSAGTTAVAIILSLINLRRR